MAAAIAADANGQSEPLGDGQTKSLARSEWAQRVLRRGGNPLRTASANFVHGDPQLRQAVVQQDLSPTPAAKGESDAVLDMTPFEPAEMLPPGMAAARLPCDNCYGQGDGCETYDNCCDPCGDCGDQGCYGGCGHFGYGCGSWGWWTREMTLFAGVHGFKGPTDQGRNGNFGFQEGANIGLPLGIGALGFQAGVAGVHSNFEGDRIFGDGRSGSHNQVFFTTGIFRRALCQGLQWGIAFDLLHDNYYYDNADLTQVRTETGYVLAGGCREIGYFGAYGTGDERVIDAQLDPTDMFAIYYRRYFSGGGDGRIWAGFSGRGDGLIGADLYAPLGKGWALENRVAYLIPKQGDDDNGQREESWALTIQLVKHLGRPARCGRSSPFRPLFSVADNAMFMVDRLYDDD